MKTPQEMKDGLKRCMVADGSMCALCPYYPDIICKEQLLGDLKDYIERLEETAAARNNITVTLQVPDLVRVVQAMKGDI